MTSRVIDIHHHILPPGYMSALGDRLGAQGLFGSPPEWSPQISLEAMDRHGITAAITSISAPGVWFGDQAEANKLARLCNEYAAQMKRDHPGRFGFFAILPLPGTDDSLREIEYAFKALNADGVVLTTNYSGLYPGEDVFRPVLDELNRRKAVVFFHPAAGNYPNPLPHIPIPSLEFPFETTRAIVSLLYSGALTRTHDARYVFSHAGGALPFLASRIARLAVREDFKKAVPDGVPAELRRLFFDTALSANLLAFEPMRRVAPLTNIIFGSDYPHAGEPTMAATLQGLSEINLSQSEIEGVRYKNAAALFPRLGLG